MSTTFEVRLESDQLCQNHSVVHSLTGCNEHNVTKIRDVYGSVFIQICGSRSNCSFLQAAVELELAEGFR